MSPKIPLTTPIASSMNVSDCNIDVGNLTAQNSSTWSIPNISITQIPQNPTNTQMHVSEGPGSTPEISSKANPQSKFPCDFLLNPGPNPVVSQEPFVKSKQPTLNIPSVSQAHVGGEKPVDGGQQKIQLENFPWSGLLEENPRLILHQNMAPKGKKVQSKINSSCQFIKRNIMDDEDENMFPNHSETNDDPRRNDIMMHEEGTQSNSEFTQSMVEQSKIRHQRNQACKAQNAAKHSSQKKKQR
ncbi:hypothetical protein O181_090552 [Austropuccinia psidii MF-1]|uniref:Uncharacterized protein n=1 Tax=Austropuccinia psidii MF-1 TaxID=1389203 RepID=A0A9Q3P7S6_9BASI|nr:hypothetical protein [Austropuccinia psidii MF-1]